MAFVVLSLRSSRPRIGALSLAMGAVLSLSRPVAHQHARRTRATGSVVLAAPLSGSFRVVCLDRRGQRVLLQSGDSVAVGTRILSWIRPHPVRSPAHPWAFDEAAFWAGRGIRLHAFEEMRFQEHRTWKTRWSEVLSAWRSRIRHRLLSGAGTGDGAALMLGMATGDRTALSVQAKAAFSTLGLAHITAVSGMHVGLLALLVSSVLKWLPKPWRATTSLAAIWAPTCCCVALQPRRSGRRGWRPWPGERWSRAGKAKGFPSCRLSACCCGPLHRIWPGHGTQVRASWLPAGILIWHAGRTPNGHASWGRRCWP